MLSDVLHDVFAVVVVILVLVLGGGFAFLVGTAGGKATRSMVRNHDENLFLGGLGQEREDDR